MKVGIDISKLHKFNKTRGIGFYTEHLYNALRKYTKIDIKLIENNTHEHFDVIHYPYFDFFNATLPIRKKCPTAVTIHDTIPLAFPEHYPAGIKGSINLIRQKFALKNVEAIITDSRSSQQDVIKFLGVEEPKVFPIYLAPGESFKPINDAKRLDRVRRKYHLPEKFALYVGNVNWNKNLVNLTAASVDISLDICLIGSGFETAGNLGHPELSSFKDFLSKFYNHPKVHILGFINEDDLICVYNLAYVLLMPSFYEGFGLPILEAQACGCPVITSNTSSIPEVARDAAIFVNPKNAAEISKSIQSITSNASKRDNLIKKGLKNARRFSWKKTAMETQDVYNKLAIKR